MPLPLLGVIVYKQFLPFPQFATVGNFCPDALTQMRKPNLTSCQARNWHLSVANSSLLHLSRAPDVVAYLMVSSFLWPLQCWRQLWSLILLECPQGWPELTRCKHYSENLSTVGAHGAVPSPTMTGHLLSVLKSFSLNTLSWKGHTRNVQHVIHLTVCTGWSQDEGRWGDLYEVT